MSIKKELIAKRIDEFVNVLAMERDWKTLHHQTELLAEHIFRIIEEDDRQRVEDERVSVAMIETRAAEAARVESIRFVGALLRELMQYALPINEVEKLVIEACRIPLNLSNYGDDNSVGAWRKTAHALARRLVEGKWC